MAYNPLTGQVKSVGRIIFDKYDVDSSGFINREEFRSLCYDRGHYLSDEELEAALLRIDTDGENGISFDEFEKFWKSDGRFGSLQSEKAVAIVYAMADFFKYYDVNESGSLEVDEFPAMYDNLVSQGYAMDPYDDTLKKMDLTGDGLINFNEFLQYLIGLGLLDMEF